MVDQNDNAPRFNEKIYDVSILENVSVGHVLLVLYAKDEDSGLNANVSYSILAGSGMNTFSLNKTSGINKRLWSWYQYCILGKEAQESQ